MLIPVKSGIMQGCPLSGLPYATIMDPPLRAMADGSEAAQVGVARACADDVGAADGAGLPQGAQAAVRFGGWWVRATAPARQVASRYIGKLG